jgi:hypothetical protein
LAAGCACTARSGCGAPPARTRLLELDAPVRVAGTAEVGGSTRALVAWDLEPRDGGGRTLVRVGTEVQRLGPVDRVLRALVGRRVMARGFPAVLERLDSASRACRFG